jgi:hypothetical protein
MASLEVARTTADDALDAAFDPTWGATFTWSHYSLSATRNHCVFCWAAFVEPGDAHADARDSGYVASLSALSDECLWVCESCFHENKDEFAWQVAPTIVQ